MLGTAHAKVAALAMIATITVAGCADPGTFRFGEPLVIVQGADTDTTVDVAVTPPAGSFGVAYDLQFQKRGIGLPSSLTVDGVPKLQAGGCQKLGGMGAAVLPAVVVLPEALGGPTPDEAGSGQDVTVGMAGPAVGQVRVTWAVPYTCDGSQVFSGVTTLTMFPSGRIVRNDEMFAPAVTPLEVSPDCACAGATNTGTLTMSSFFGFVPGTDVGPDDSPATDDQTSGCTLYDDSTIAVAGPEDIHRTDGPAEFRCDMGSSNATLTVDPQITTAVQLAPGGTKCVAAVSELGDGHLVIADQDVASDLNGLYPAQAPLPDRFTIKAKDQAVPGGFAVVLPIDPHAAITRADVTTDPLFVSQILDDGDVLLWFPDGLSGDQEIDVDLNP